MYLKYAALEIQPVTNKVGTILDNGCLENNINMIQLNIYWDIENDITCFCSESIRNTRYKDEQNKKLNNMITNIDTIVDFVSWLSKFPLPFLVPVELLDNDNRLPLLAELISVGEYSPIL